MSLQRLFWFNVMVKWLISFITISNEEFQFGVYIVGINIFNFFDSFIKVFTLHKWQIVFVYEPSIFLRNFHCIIYFSHKFVLALNVKLLSWLKQRFVYLRRTAVAMHVIKLVKSIGCTNFYIVDRSIWCLLTSIICFISVKDF